LNNGLVTPGRTIVLEKPMQSTPYIPPRVVPQIVALYRRCQYVKILHLF